MSLIHSTALSQTQNQPVLNNMTERTLTRRLCLRRLTGGEEPMPGYHIAFSRFALSPHGATLSSIR